ncbi:ABC-2 type transporter-domain-containing protein [Pyronema domesticum]|uniref:Similar to Brefeldin A resistance protein acc. no. P41820 n=1 Tax=Pyronema omphalodes (strain CBS 100304) TaxID=1076935 RepID=U4KXJ7_PYROM|nr:ABC-2 type transporter-domain-containing protein [Pyronema domesticum]CCX04269.1 Similar to Brefeldin A resistance protein; acc. no. P41820 [Pyronema omphalodes CBS 100304]
MASDQPIAPIVLAAPVYSSSSSGSTTPVASGPPTPAGEPYKPLHSTGNPEITSASDAEAELIRTLSRRGAGANPADNEEIENLLSKIFGENRQQNSAEEQTRHVGVVFKDLTVKGLGLGAALMPTNGDLFLGPLRGIRDLVSGNKTKGPQVRTLLHEFTGCIRPRELLLVLGRPGAGCTTFLKVLGNQRKGFQEITGEVRYGGEDWKVMEKQYRGEVLYNPEEDLHYATLTVKDTLQFALKTKTPAKESRAEGETRRGYVAEFLRVVTKLFWIEHTLDTRLGNEIVRGVSGGEKKRVSIAEAMVTKASVQCWDNSTKGLDASTALEYVQALRTLTNMAKISTAVALYQAGESLYDLFDKVILIDQGRCVYFGPAQDAKKYFEDLGFACPSARWTTADFLTSVTDPNERHIKPGFENRVPRTAEDFEAAFRRSDIARRNLQDIEEFEASLHAQKDARAQATTQATGNKNYTIGFPAQVAACTVRQFKVMFGDRLSLGAKWIGIIFQSIVVGSLFYNMPSNALGVFPRGGILFFTLLFNALLALAELGDTFNSRPLLMKHKSFSFYRPSAYAIAQVVTDIPLSAIQVTLFGTIVYFMCNLDRQADKFFIFLLFSFFLTLSVCSFFRMIGAYAKDLNAASGVVGPCLQALIVYAGYLIPPTSMKPWFSWLRWVNPVQYAFEGIMVNEFTGLEIDCVAPFTVPFGPGVTPEHQSCLIRGSRPGTTLVKGEDYVRLQFGYTRDHLWRNLGIIIAYWLLFAVLCAIGLERQQPNKGGAAVTVFKRGQAPTTVVKSLEKGADAADEESGATGVINPANEKQEETVEQIARNDTVFTWQNVTYTIPTKAGERVLLNDVSGYVRPGRLTALMGESGAGKTTLLNVLAQRIDFGVVKGEFLVNGHPLPLSFQRATGFAEQADIHEPTTTVREAMQFSALLRQGSEVSKEEKLAYAEKIIRLLEMEDIAGATVGKPGMGLNQEQRKRLTIGVELAAKPELLMFLDEPTSGMDSAAAYNVVRFLRKLADAGQAILCTIHQPSAVLFENFDEIVLLKSGGSLVYHGPLGKDSETIIQYFESNGAPKCPPKRNPAEYILEAIGVGDPTRKSKDWGQVWRDSPESQQRLTEIQNFIAERRQNASHTADERQFAVPIMTQMKAVMRRTFASYWRNPDYVTGIMMLHIFCGLFTAFTFYQLGNSVIDMQSRLFSIFLTLTIAPPLIQQSQPQFLAIRDLFTARENKARIYHWTVFVTSAILVEIPYRFLAGTFYFVAWYFPVGFPRDSGSVGYSWLLMMLFELYYMGLSQGIASFCPNELLAAILVPISFLFIISFCGVVVPYSSMPEFWKSWMYWTSPFTYIFEGWLGVLVNNVPVRCAEEEFARFTPPPGLGCEQYVQGFMKMAGGYVRETIEEGQTTCEFCQASTGQEFARGFSVNFENKWRNVGVVAGFVVFNMGVVFVGSWLYLGGAKRVWRVIRRK